MSHNGWSNTFNWKGYKPFSQIWSHFLLHDGEDIWSHNSEYSQIQMQGGKEHPCWCSNLEIVLNGDSSQRNQQKAILNILCGLIRDHIYKGHGLIEDYIRLCNHLRQDKELLATALRVLHLVNSRNKLI